MTINKETELYSPVKEWLEKGGNTVYAEVKAKRGSSRADVVGLSGNILTVVELKTTLSLDLVEQAIAWRGHANYIWAAVPESKSGLRPIIEKILSENGVGVLRVTEWGVRVELKAKAQRRITDNLRGALTDYHLKYSPEGGTKGGGYITDYRITMLRVREFLEKVKDPSHIWTGGEFFKDENGDYQTFRSLNHKYGGWADIKTILEYCSTHYSSPKQSLAAALQNFESDWCESKKENRRLYYRIKDGKESWNENYEGGTKQ